MSVPSPAMAASKPIVQPSLMEKLDLIPGFMSLLGAALYAAITGPFRGDWGADTYLHHVTHSMVRKMVIRFSTAQLQYIGEPFGKIYEKWCKANHMQPEFVTLESGCKAFWLGEKTAKYIVVYFHGGGFSLDGDDTHLAFWRSVQNDIATSGKSVSWLFVEYTLVPHGTYPVQIKEGIEAVQYVLNDLKRPASDIILAGDSAGGQLSLSLLSHISHPAPSLSPIDIPESAKLKAVIVVAPWVSFRTDFPSAQRCAYKDLLSASKGRQWGLEYLGGKPSDNYVEALNAPTSWWEGAKVEQMFVCAGGDEMLIDPITEWVNKYKSVNPENTTFVVGKNEVHIAPIIEPRFGDNKETEQGKAIKAFMKARL